MATAKKKAPAKKAAPAKKVNKKVSGRSRSDIDDESDLVKRNEYFNRGGQRFVRFPSGDVMPIDPPRGGRSGGGAGGARGNSGSIGGRGMRGGGGAMLGRGK